ncbi:DUF4258 domain-containing protein [Nocardia takedensis]
MQLIITTHASQRMRQRRISRADIEHALQCCEMHTSGDNDGLCHHSRSASGRPLKIWTAPTLIPLDHSETFTVKSVAWKGTS